MGLKDPESNRHDDESRSRDNGWTLPLHPLQFVAWIVVLVFTFVFMTTLVPALHVSWQPAGYIIPGVSLVVHIATHIVASTINPADPAVLRKKNGNKPASFDRTKHDHVIENCYCYICEVDVEMGSKHCSVCNKCVSGFDHHCKWLNNCIGHRNYRWFLATLISGIVAMSLVVIVAIAEFVGYFTDRTSRTILQPFIELNETLSYEEADFQIVYQTVPHKGWLTLMGTTFVLGAIAIALIVHLFGFHVYLMCKDMTTYDYIVLLREEEKKKEKDAEVVSIGSGKRGRKNRVMPSALDRPKTSIISTAIDDKDYQKVLEEAEAANRTEGETPPPSNSPVHRENNNNNNYDKSAGFMDKTAIKKLKRKKKKKPSNTEDNNSEISTIDHPRMYHSKGYTVAKVDIPAIANPVRIMPPPPSLTPTPRGTGVAPVYHSDSADSLLEVSADMSFSMNTKGSIDLNNTQLSNTQTSHGEKKSGKKAKQKKKRKEKDGAGLKSDDELNDTMVFTLNKSAKLNADGSINYSDGFRELPFTPTSTRKNDKTKTDQTVPPLDFTGLAASSDSLSFQPFSATFRSTDTHGTDRLLPVLKEERIKNRLNTVEDTEV